MHNPVRATHSARAKRQAQIIIFTHTYLNIAPGLNLKVLGHLGLGMRSRQKYHIRARRATDYIQDLGEAKPTSRKRILTEILLT